MWREARWPGPGATKQRKPLRLRPKREAMLSRSLWPGAWTGEEKTEKKVRGGRRTVGATSSED